MARRHREILDRIAVPPSSEASLDERVHYLRPAALPGVEALHASFVTHRYPAHVHESWTVATVKRGAATFELDGSRHVAPAGTTFVIPPGAVHTGEPATADGYRYQVLYLSPVGGWETAEHSWPDRPHRTAMVVVRYPALFRSLTRAHAALAAPAAALEQGEALASVISVLDAVVSGHEPTNEAYRPRAVSEAIDYIHAHLAEDFSLLDLATAVGLSPHYMTRTFRDWVGTPPSSYRRALRVVAAQRLLRLGRPPAEVAADCGFYDQSHLHRHFKAVSGVTPRQFALAS